MGSKKPNRRRERARKRGSRRRFFAKVSLLFAVLALAIGGVWFYLRTQSATYQVSKMQEQAQLHLRLGQFEDAIPLLEKCVALLPQVPGLVVQLSGAYRQAGRPEEAERVLREGLLRLPENRILSVALARHLLEEDRGEEAYAVLSPVLESIRKIPEPEERAAALTLAGRAAAKAGSLDEAEKLLAEAAVGENLASALLALGEVQAEGGKLAAAEESLRKAWRLAPARSEILVALARVLERNGERAEAERELATAFRAGGDAPFAIAPFYAELLLRGGEDRKALALADELARDGRGLVVAAQIRGMAAAASGDDGAAEQEFIRWSQLSPDSALPLLYIARLASRRGDPAGARAAYEDALLRQSGLPEAELGLLDLDERAGDLAAVRKRAERLLAAPDTRARAIRALIESYAEEQDQTEVLARIAALRELFPEDRGLRLHEAVFRLLAGQTEVAIESLRKLVDEGPDETSTFALLAAAHEQESDAVEAMEMLSRLAAEDPRFASARVVLAQLYRRLRRPDLARRQIDAALQERPDHEEARWIRAQLATIEGDQELALTDLKSLRELEPRNALVAGALVELLTSSGERAQALAILEEARSIQPGSAIWPARMGAVYARSGEIDRALAAYEDAQRLAPTYPPAHEDGLVLLAHGRVVQAKVALSRALEKSNDPRFAAALAIACCLCGEPARGLEPLLVWRSRSGDRSAEGAVAHAMVLALARDRGRAEAVLRTARGVPEVVRSAVLGLLPGPGGAPDRGARLALEIFAFRAAGWKDPRLSRIELAAEEPGTGILATWWALESIERTQATAPTRLTLAGRLAGAAPDSTAAGLALALAQLDAGDRRAHLQTLRDLAARFPTDSDVALFSGMALEREGDGEGALREYTRAAGGRSPSPAALNNLAYLLGEEPGQRQAAIQYARQAVRLAPRNGSVLDTLGWLLFRDDQLEEGVRVLQQAVAASPSSATIRYHFARVLEARGNDRRATGQLEMAFLVRGEFPEQAEARKLLVRLKSAPGIASTTGGATTDRLVLDRPFEGRLGSDGRSIHNLPSFATRREVRIDFRAPADSPAIATVVRAGVVIARLEAEAGREVSIPRLEVTPEEHVIVVQASEPEAPASPVRLEVRSAAGEGELEPNDHPKAARTLATGERWAGSFHGAADVDCYRLGLASDRSAVLSVTAGEATEVLLEVLSVTGDPAKIGRVPPGRTAVVPGLFAPEHGDLVLRLGPGAGRGSGAASYQVELSPGPAGVTDREPNDRPRDAIRLELGASSRGRVGIADAADWYRIDAPGRLLSLGLRSSPPIALEIWEEGDSMSISRRYEVSGSDLFVPRWKPPASGVLWLAVYARGDAPERPYELSVEEAITPEVQMEIEPNDSAARAVSVDGEGILHGSLDLASDVDWLRLPNFEPKTVAAIEVELDDASAMVLLDVFAGEPAAPRFLGRFASEGGRLLVPALDVQDRRGLVALSSRSGAAGGYRVRLAKVSSSARVETEPNDESERAVELRRFGFLTGRISGALDRDLVRIETAGPVAVRATGDAPIAVRILDREETLVVEPGTEAELSATGGALVEISAPQGSGSPRPERRYELRAGAEGDREAEH